MQTKISQRMQAKIVNRQSGTGVNKKAFPNTCNLSEMQTHVIYQKMQINIVNRQDQGQGLGGESQQNELKMVYAMVLKDANIFIPFPISGFMCASIENNIIMLPMRHPEKRFTNTDMKAS